ncbi:hypothetical protein NLG97_g6944 [Lecanicillium saksenae]|uniref:Uncharacterized protein n=1 Tax=Lecanicillium saksenae TaxID=468837 RepID=A0ACC1QNS3_9HYPO|nr:hypothetical protein NLG97_g6944 [Lecanicillium saksenae]
MTFKKTLLLAATTAATAFGAALAGFEECGTLEATEEFMAAARKMQVSESFASQAVSNQRLASNIIVPTYYHVVHTSNDEKGGYLTEADLKANLADLNQDYVNMGFQFEFKGVDYNTSSTWAAGDEMASMRSTLRKGDYRSLNLFFIPVMKDNGLCTLPTANEDWKRSDGCVVRTDVRTNGQTTTHEVGHWLGLLHTFQAPNDTITCDATNDMVDDTPALINKWSCNANDDTCPGLPGKDPVNNYMS